MKRNPWALTDEQARERDETIYRQFFAALPEADRIANPRRRIAFLERQFGHPAVRAAIMRAVVRKQGARS